MTCFFLDADVDESLLVFLKADGHTGMTTKAAGRRRAGDEEQRAFAAIRGCVFVTHNRDDFVLLQRAWRYWSDLWQVSPPPIHPGILVVPQQGISLANLATQMNAFVRSPATMENRCHRFILGRGWSPVG